MGKVVSRASKAPDADLVKAATTALVSLKRLARRESDSSTKRMRDLSLAAAAASPRAAAGAVKSPPPSSSPAASPTAASADSAASADAGAHTPMAPASAARIAVDALPADRQRMVRILSGPITKHVPSGTADEVQQAAARLEASLFTSTKGASVRPAGLPTYGDQIRSFVLNMGRNPKLVLGVFEDTIDLDRLAVADPSELATSEFKEQAAKEKQAAAEEVQLDWQRKHGKDQLKAAGLKPVSGQFKCPRCKGSNTDYYEKQTRSADEPMTVFNECLDCGKRWRF